MDCPTRINIVCNHTEKTAYIFVNGRKLIWNKIRFGDPRRQFVFYSIFNNKNGPELMTEHKGLTAEQFSLYARTTESIRTVLKYGGEVEICTEFEPIGLHALSLHS